MGKLDRVVRIRAFRALVWALLFLTALGLTYSRVLTANPGEISGRYDVYRYFGPNAFFMDTALHSGEFPLWNPLVYCGMPFAANPQASACYPPHIARGLLNFSPTPRSTQQSIVALMALHLLLGAAGTYRLARAHQSGRPGAYAAAVAFTFSALMVRRACEYHFLYTLNWLPWILLFVKRSIDAAAPRAKLANGAAAGALAGLAVLGGFFQIVPYMAVASVAYAVTWRLLNLRNAGRRAALADLAAAAVAIIVAVGLAAVLLVPAAELAGLAARQPDTAIAQYSNLSAAGIGQFLRNLVVYAGMRYHPEAVRASGAAALMLVAAGVLMRPRRRTLAMAIPWLMLVDCTFGPPMPVATLVQWLTPFATAATTRAFDVALLPLSLLAGFGVDALADPGKPRIGPKVRASLATIFGAAALAVLALSLRSKPFLDVPPYALLVPGLALMAIAAAPWLSTRKNALTAIRVALPLLIFLETLAWNRQYVPWLVGRGQGVRHTAAGWPRLGQNRRYVDPLANNAMFQLKPIVNGYDPLHLRAARDVVSAPPRDRAYHRLVTDREPTAGSHRGNLFLKRPFWLVSAYAEGPLPPKDRLFPPAALVYLETGAGLPVPKLSQDAAPSSALSSAHTMVSSLPPPEKGVPAGTARSVRFQLDLPETPGPAGVAHSTLVLEYESTCPAAIDLILSDRNSRDTQPAKSYRLGSTGGQLRSVQFPLPDIAAMHATLKVAASGRAGSFAFRRLNVYAEPNDEDALLRDIVWRANSVRLTVQDAPGDRILLFTDADYPGWRARVDGSPAPIYRANDAFKAIPIPPGSHDVEFTFRPNTLYAGAAISGATLFLLLLAYLYLAQSRRAAGSFA